MKHSTVCYTTKDGIKEKAEMRFGHPIEARLFTSDLELDDCTDIIVETDGVFYNSEGIKLQSQTTSFDDFLKEEGIYEACKEEAIKKTREAGL